MVKELNQKTSIEIKKKKRYIYLTVWQIKKNFFLNESSSAAKQNRMKSMEKQKKTHS